MTLRKMAANLGILTLLALAAAQAPQTTLKAIQTYSGHRGPVEALAFSPDSSRLFVMSSQTGYVLDTQTKQVLLTFPIGAYSARASWVSERSLRIDASGKVLYFDPTTGQKTGGRQFNAKGHQTIVSPGGIAAVEGDEVIDLFDVNSGNKIRSINVSGRYLDSIALSHDGHRLAVADSSSGAVLYNADNGRVIRELVPKADWAEAVTFSPDGRKVIVAAGLGDDEASLRIFDAVTGELLDVMDELPDSLDTFAWGNSHLLLGADYGDVYLIDPDEGKLRFSFSGFERSNLTLAASPDGQNVAYGSWFGDLKFASPVSGRVTQSLAGFPGSSIWCLELSPNSKLLLTCGYDHTARVFDVATGKTVAALPGHAHWVEEGKFLPGGGIATLSDSTIFLWNSQGQRLKTWTHQQDEVEHLTPHPSGKYLAYNARDYGEDNDFIIREVATGKIVARLPQGEALPGAAVFSPNGKTLYILDSEGRILAWNWSQGAVISRTNVGDDYREKLLIDSQGRYLALAAPSGGVLLLDATSLKKVRDFPMYRTQDFAFNVNGEKLIVKGDQKITVFAVKSGQALQTYGSPQDGDFVLPLDGATLLLEGAVGGKPNNATLYQVPQGTPFK